MALRYASGLFQGYLLFLSLFSPFILKLLKSAIFRPKNIFTELLLPPQKLGALGGRLVRLVVKSALQAMTDFILFNVKNNGNMHCWLRQLCNFDQHSRTRYHGSKKCKNAIKKKAIGLHEN